MHTGKEYASNEGLLVCVPLRHGQSLPFLPSFLVDARQSDDAIRLDVDPSHRSVQEMIPRFLQLMQVTRLLGQYIGSHLTGLLSFFDATIQFVLNLGCQLFHVSVSVLLMFHRLDKMMEQRILVHLIVMVICPIQKVRTSTLLKLSLYGLDKVVVVVVVGMMSYYSDLLRRVLGGFDVDHTDDAGSFQQQAERRRCNGFCPGLESQCDTPNPNACLQQDLK